MVIPEEDVNRLAQACELLTQGVVYIQKGQVKLGYDTCEAGLILLKPTDNMRLPTWFTSISEE
jgi:hypothetical protein